MQKVIYIDVLVFINSVLTLLILMTTSDIIKNYPARKRYLAGAFAGGLASLAIFLPENIFTGILIKTVESSLIVFITFGFRNLKSYIKSLSGFFLSSFLYGGIVFASGFVVGRDILSFNNGYFYSDLNAVSLIVICGSIFIVLKLTDIRYFRVRKKDIIYEVELYLNSKSYSFKAFLDSGNNVVDSFTGKPVVILSLSVIKSGFTSEENEAIRSIIDGRIPEYLPAGIRLLPVKTLGQQKLLPAITADKLIVRNNDFSRTVISPAIVMSGDSFGEEKYSALINSDLAGEVL